MHLYVYKTYAVIMPYLAVYKPHASLPSSGESTPSLANLILNIFNFFFPVLKCRLISDKTRNAAVQFFTEGTIKKVQ